MNKARILIIILSLVILFAGRVKADWDDFRAAVQSPNTIVDFNNPDIGYENPINYVGDGLALASDKIFIGLRGSNNFAALQGANSYFAFHIDNKTVHFYDNWKFLNFSNANFGGAIYADNTSNIYFTTAVIHFINNKTDKGGGAIYITGNSNINFTSSVVHFTSNSANDVMDGGGAIYVNSSNVNFTSSVVHFTSNTAGQDGGAIYAGNISTINFTDSLVNFIDGISANFGAAIYATDGSNINFTSSVVNFIGNNHIDSSVLGGAIYSKSDANINFANSKINFANNKGEQGGAIFNIAAIVFSSSVIHFTKNTANDRGGAIDNEGGTINSSNSVIYFTSNSAGGNGGALAVLGVSNINFTSSVIHFTSNSAGASGGAISVGNPSNINFINSEVNFTSNSADGSGGAIYINNNLGKVNFFNSTVNFVGNRAATGNGGAIFMTGTTRVSEIRFIAQGKNMSVKFQDNRRQGQLNDIWFANVFSSVVFQSSQGNAISLVSGIRIDGAANAGRVRKLGGGNVIFEESAAAIINVPFMVEEGTAVFRSAKSTVSALNISAGAMLDLRGGAISTLFITGAGNSFTLNGWLGLDFNFHTNHQTTPWLSTGDFVRINNQAIINTSTIAARFINAPTVAGSSLAFMRTGGFQVGFSTENIFVAGDSGSILPDFWVNKDANNILWLVLGAQNIVPSIDPWDVFVTAYKAANDDEQVQLNENIYAYGDSALAFGDPADNGRQNITVDGKYHIVHSSGFEDKGFVIENSSITFRDISFTSFVGRGGDGGVMSIFNSTIIFRGSAAWTNNMSENSGGAIAAYDSNINFTISAVYFTSNAVARMGGALYLANSIIGFRASTVVFKANRSLSNSGAGAIAAYDSDINFASSVVHFSSNAAAVSGGAIYIAGNSNINFTSSVVHFTINRAIAGGGGAIFALDSNINFTRSTVHFTRNMALNTNNNSAGGAIYTRYSNINFTNSVVNFTSNTLLTNSGGAISANNSNINFTNSAVNFTSNTAALNGGAVFFQGSSISFAASTVVFKANRSRDYAGALEVDHSSFSFINGNIHFTSNYVTGASGFESGGGLLTTDGSFMEFRNSEINFTSNSANYAGGALVARDSKIKFENTVVNFIDNRATVIAGAIGSSEAVVSFYNSTVTFRGNTAGYYGGAIYALLKSSISFISANLAAGQIARSAHQVVFYGNKTLLTGAPNDIYLDDSQLWMTGGMWMEGGLIAANKSTVSYSGRHWYLSGRNDFDNMGRFDVRAASMTIVNATWTYRSGAQMTIGASTLNFINSSVTFTQNAKNGALNISGGSYLSFNNSIVEISSNSNSDGGAIYISGNSRLHFLNSKAVFSKNKALANGGSIYLANSVLIFERSTFTVAFSSAVGNYAGAFYGDTASSISFVRSSITFIGNVSYSVNGNGVIYSVGQIFFIDNPFILFENNQIRNGAITVVKTTFSAINSDSEIVFRNNIDTSGGRNDIHQASGGEIIFDAADGRTIRLSNGVRISYGGTIGTTYKIGGGKILFEGETKIDNKFNILAGTAVFRSAKSTVSALNISAGAMLDLRGGAISTLFITGAGNSFTLNGWLGLDFNFHANHQTTPWLSTGDFVRINNQAIINTSTIAVRFINAPTVAGSSLAFMRTGGFQVGFSTENIFVAGDSGSILPDFWVNKDANNILWLVLGAQNIVPSIDPWDVFVTAYKDANDDEQVQLNENIYAYGDSALAFGDPADNGRQNITVDGKYHIVHSSGFINKGFVIENSSITFRDIVFTSFVRTSDDGGVMSIVNSTIVFRSSVSWINNSGDSSSLAGAISAFNSNIEFKNAIVSFTSNFTPNYYGAVYLYESRFIVENSSVIFMNNINNYRGTIYISGISSISFSANNHIAGSIDYPLLGGWDFVFIDNTNDIISWDSEIWMKGNTWMGGGMEINGSSFTYSGGTWFLSGANYFEDMALFDVRNVSATLRNAFFKYLNGAAVNISRSTMIFEYSTFSVINSEFKFADGGDLVLTNSRLLIEDSRFLAAGGIKAQISSVAVSGGRLNLGGANTFINMNWFGVNNSWLGVENGTITVSGGGQSAPTMSIVGSTVSFTRSSVSFAGGLPSAPTASIVLANSRLLIEDSRFLAAGGIKASASSAAVSGALVKLGGLNEFKNMNWFALSNSQMTVDGATLTWTGGLPSAPTTAINSTITFTGQSSVTFSGNGDLDIKLANSRLNFEGNGRILFRNGLRVSGGEAVKSGIGKVVFEGAGTILPNLTISAGTAVFHSPKSTVSALTVAAGAMLDLRGGSTSTLFITGAGTAFVLNGALGLDFRFENAAQHLSKSTSDFISAVNSINISASAILLANISLADIADTAYGSSIAFMKGSAISGEENLSAPTGYEISKNNNVLWLVYGGLNPWNAFVLNYRAASAGETVYLSENIEAFSGALDLSWDLNGGNFTIEGSGFTANSAKVADLGFVINDSSLTFIDINLTSFTRLTGIGGGAMKIVNSEIFMRGDFSFSENEALNGGAIYVEKSTVYFSPKSKTMQIEFKNNRAVYGGDVYAEDSSLIFDAKNFSIDLSNGMRMRGGKIEKTGGRDLIFRGENSVLESDLIIKEGAAIFTSFGSTVANITIESSGTLSLAGGAFNKLFVATVFSSGTLIFDLNFSALSAFGDAICGGSVSIASGSVLKINEINRDTWIYGSSTKIIWTNANSLSLNINDILYDGSIYKLIKTDNSLWIKYYGQLPNLRKLNLTHNQDEAYSSLQYYRDVLESDKIKSAKERESFQKYAVEMNEIIADVFSTSDTDRIKQSLDVLSGSFLAQTIVEVSMDSPHKMLYSGLNPFSLADLPQRGDDLRSLKFRALWVDVGVKAAQRNDEKNLLGVFEKASAQAALGFNFIESTDLIAGMFGRTAITQIKQDENKAEIQSYEGGFYGGIFSRFFDHKFFAAFGYHNAFTKRKIDLGRGYNPQAAFDLYTLRIGGENSLIISEYIHLYAGVLFSQVYNDELQETDGGPVGLKVEQSRYNRFDGYGGLRIGPRNFYFSIEAGYLIYGNLEQARFGMFMGGFNHRMDIEGSNADPLYFSANVGWDKKLSDDFTLQTMGGVSSDKDEQSKSAALNVRLKYLFPTAKSEKAYRDILFKNFKTIEEFNRPRKDILLDKNTGWGKGNPAVNPDKKGEDKMQENSHSKNRMLVQVLTEDAEGKLKWRNFITMDMKIFKPGSSEIGEKVSKIISEEMGKLDEKNLKVSRVRIGRYGHSLEDEEMKLAQARAENIYEAMFLYKENLEKAERQKLAEEEAKKLSEDKKKKEQERLREAKARRENSIVSYKIKAASFEVGHARLSREALENLDDLAFEIKRTKYKTITVEGHTDSTGSRERNLFLSEERAMAVYMELLKRGIPAEKLKIAAFGPDMPAGDNATAEGRLSNRRVEIFVE